MPLIVGKKLASFQTRWGGDLIKGKYSPWDLTKAFWKDLGDRQDTDRIASEKAKEDGVPEPEKLASTAWMIVQLVKEWDIYEADEETMYPITEESLDELPTPLVNAIAESLMDDIGNKSPKSVSKTA